ncbi:SRPBCC family protein [Kribbella pratensis]|uniref:Ribosome-associated toxin RatA of RatAB toxin-antitoxin module n=1 Tax=Kribbella pratensis TaxID=2512112 RepID=A0A4R8CKD3_9ACTN|nr:SRPBCC family protein [Kribbella pratensis]TDW75233.1 ribosome-associated toxin RatA of RatAB toxin-antitoxin module [Kribbella pratensis]
MPDLTESISVAASPATLYSLVSDLPRMREWSPECTRVTWTTSSRSASSGSVAGRRFIGHNRAGVVRWFTFGRVEAAEPGRRFTFSIHFGPIPISLWNYSFTPTASGCEVTESWTDRRPRVLRAVFRPVFGNRTPRNANGIHTTLVRLKSAAESALTPE